MEKVVLGVDKSLKKIQEQKTADEAVNKYGGNQGFFLQGQKGRRGYYIL